MPRGWCSAASIHERPGSADDLGLGVAACCSAGPALGCICPGIWPGRSSTGPGTRRGRRGTADFYLETEAKSVMNRSSNRARSAISL